ncbi:unnamed protein product [Trichobilharzia regenti]|nr:unnamed protein product [Trichobilharzia regenti]
MQVKGNKLEIEEASKIGITSGEHRENRRGDEDYWSTAAATTTDNNQHKLECSKRINLIYLRGQHNTLQERREIMLLSTPSKILSRIILERLKDALQTEHRPEQAGFRKGKSCSDQIATLHVIITEQSMEWQSNLCLNFIDFEKAFDRQH